MLLKTLKREYIDWQAVEEKHIPRRNCHGLCMSLRLKDEFSVSEWKNKDDPHCKVCVQKRREHGTPYRCTRCRHWFAEGDFESSYTCESLRHRICKTCADVKPRRCSSCLKDKPEAAFTEKQWKHSRKADRTCMACMTGRSCSVCKTTGGQVQTFTACEWHKPDEERKCLMCMTKRCTKCRRDRKKSLFSADQWQLPDESPARTCYDCNRKQCSTCFKPKGQREFDRRSWQLEDKDPGRVCLACANGSREVGMWTCANLRCKLRKRIDDFSLARAKRGPKVRGGGRQCNACVERFAAECAEVARDSARQSVKRRRLE